MLKCKWLSNGKTNLCLLFFLIHAYTVVSRDVFSGLQLASVKNCTFKRNSASEFGAAVCLNSLLFLVETSSLSLVTIMDW